MHGWEWASLERTATELFATPRPREHGEASQMGWKEERRERGRDGGREEGRRCVEGKLVWAGEWLSRGGTGNCAVSEGGEGDFKHISSMFKFHGFLVFVIPLSLTPSLPQTPTHNPHIISPSPCIKIVLWWWGFFFMPLHEAVNITPFSLRPVSDQLANGGVDISHHAAQSIG